MAERDSNPDKSDDQKLNAEYLDDDDEVDDNEESRFANRVSFGMSLLLKILFCMDLALVESDLCSARHVIIGCKPNCEMAALGRQR
jgi:hypothetical protein